MFFLMFLWFSCLYTWNIIYYTPNAPCIGIFTYHKSKPNVGKCTSPMEHLGIWVPDSSLLGMQQHVDLRLITAGLGRPRCDLGFFLKGLPSGVVVDAVEARLSHAWFHWFQMHESLGFTTTNGGWVGDDILPSIGMIITTLSILTPHKCLF